MANKATQTAGLVFNVNTVRNKMREYFESQGEKNSPEKTSPMLSGGQTALTAVLEKLYELILRECLKQTGKDKSALRVVTREHLQYSVLLHSGLKSYYFLSFEHFDKDSMYKDQLPVTTEAMDKVMERVDTTLSLTPRARNLACFLLHRVFKDLVSTATQFLSFAKRKSLDANCIMHVVRNRFPDGVAHELINEVTRAMKAAGETVEETAVVNNEDNTQETKTEPAEDKDEGEGEGEGESLEEKTKKTTGKTAEKVTAEKVTTAKKAGQKKSESKGNKIDKDEDCDEMSEDKLEETVEVKPKKAVTKSTKNTKAKPK